MYQEIVRFTVPSDQVAALLASRDAALQAIRQQFPGLTRAVLSRLDETTWLDVVEWGSKDEAERAAAEAPQIPAAAAMFALIDGVLSFEHAEIVHTYREMASVPS